MSLSLINGWNMLGTSGSNLSPLELLPNISGTIESVYGWSGTGYFAVDISEGKMMQGNGIWYSSQENPTPS